MAMMQC
jgi:hypothetical protein